MKHYGDITKLSGFDLEPVDVVTGGSPCQDLSIAGKREGLNGERSRLFLDQIRIIKEMRGRDRRNGITANELVRPRYMVWENVVGALSSNKGEDFRKVLEETVRIAEPKAPALSVPKKGWTKSGCLYDELGGGQLLGEYTMRGFGEYPKEGVESALSQILLDSVPRKYCLSEKACAGILRRAKKKNRSLPEEVVKALEEGMSTV